MYSIFCILKKTYVLLFSQYFPFFIYFFYFCVQPRSCVIRIYNFRGDDAHREFTFVMIVSVWLLLFFFGIRCARLYWLSFCVCMCQFITATSFLLQCLLDEFYFILFSPGFLKKLACSSVSIIFQNFRVSLFFKFLFSCKYL